MKRMDSSKPELIVLTGFGPFRQYLVNPSWEAVKGLKRMGLGTNTEIHIVEIPVCYSKAQQAIAEIWHNLKPKVAIHVGIASGTKCIFLEQTGNNSGYKDRDVCGICPADDCCIKGGAEQLDSVIDMRSIAKRLKGLGLDVIYSRDAGRYLCDFVHYLSLYYGQRRAALIHVPACGSLASPERLVPQLQTIIQHMLCQLDTKDLTLSTRTQATLTTLKELNGAEIVKKTECINEDARSKTRHWHSVPFTFFNSKFKKKKEDT